MRVTKNISISNSNITLDNESDHSEEEFVPVVSIGEEQHVNAPGYIINAEPKSKPVNIGAYTINSESIEYVSGLYNKASFSIPWEILPKDLGYIGLNYNSEEEDGKIHLTLDEMMIADTIIYEDDFSGPNVTKINSITPEYIALASLNKIDLNTGFIYSDNERSIKEDVKKYSGPYMMNEDNEIVIIPVASEDLSSMYHNGFIKNLSDIIRLCVKYRSGWLEHFVGNLIELTEEDNPTIVLDGDIKNLSEVIEKYLREVVEVNDGKYSSDKHGTVIVEDNKITFKGFTVKHDLSWINRTMFSLGLLLSVGVGIDDIYSDDYISILAPSGWTEHMLRYNGVPTTVIGNSGLLDVLIINTHFIRPAVESWRSNNSNQYDFLSVILGLSHHGISLYGFNNNTPSLTFIVEKSSEKFIKEYLNPGAPQNDDSDKDEYENDDYKYTIITMGMNDSLSGPISSMILSSTEDSFMVMDMNSRTVNYKVHSLVSGNTDISPILAMMVSPFVKPNYIDDNSIFDPGIGNYSRMFMYKQKIVSQELLVSSIEEMLKGKYDEIEPIINYSIPLMSIGEFSDGIVLEGGKTSSQDIDDFLIEVLEESDYGEIVSSIERGVIPDNLSVNQKKKILSIMNDDGIIIAPSNIIDDISTMVEESGLFIDEIMKSESSQSAIKISSTKDLNSVNGIISKDELTIVNTDEKIININGIELMREES